MLLTLRATGHRATDLETLLDKCSDKLHTVHLPFGMAHVFFPEVSPDAVTAALALDVDGVTNGSSAEFARANAATLSVAIAEVFRDALAARCPKRPDLVTSMLHIEARVSAYAVRRGTSDAQAFFAPLGYDISISERTISEDVTAPCDEVHHDVRLAKRCSLYEMLSHLYVFGPVIDGCASDRMLDGEIAPLLMHADGAVRGHPAAERIMQAYHARRVAGSHAALERLLAADSMEARAETNDVESWLDEPRLDAIVAELRAASAQSVVDLGCGDGKLLLRLVREKALKRIVGFDVSSQVLDAAAARLKLDRRAGKRSERLDLFHGSLFYKDSRLRGFDAAVLVDVIQFVDANRLADVEEVVFGDAKPLTVIVMMGRLSDADASMLNGSSEASGHSSHLGTRIAPTDLTLPTPLSSSASRRGEGGARKQALSGSPLSTSGVAVKLERGGGGVRSARRGLDKLNDDGVCEGRSALRNVMNGQAEAWSTNQFDAWASRVSVASGYRLRLLRAGSASSGARMAVFSR